MAINRIKTLGAESGIMEFDATNAGGYFTAAAGGYTGNYGYQIFTHTGLGTTLPYGIEYCPPTKQIRGGFFKYYFPSNNGSFLIRLKTAASAHLVGIQQWKTFDNGQFTIDVGGVDEVSGQGLNTVEWTHWGFDCKIDPTNGWFYWYKNGELVLSFEGNTGSSDIERIHIGHDGTDDSSYTWWLDDIYFDDTTGETEPTAPPILRFYYIPPNNNGNYNQWLGSDADQVDNYQLVDEIPANTSDYVVVSGVDLLDSYAMTQFTAVAGQQINAIIPQAYAQISAGTEQVTLGTRYSSIDVVGSGQSPAVGSYSIIQERQTTQPGGGNWTQSALTDFEVVIKSRGSY